MKEPIFAELNDGGWLDTDGAPGGLEVDLDDDHGGRWLRSRLGQVSDERRRCRLTLPEAPHRYAWSSARQGVDNSFPVDALEPWFELLQGNPLLEFARVQNVTTGAVHIPQVTTGAVSKNGNVPGAPAAPVGATIKGGLTQMDVYDLTSQVPLGPSRWVVGIESALMMEHMQRHGFAQGADTVAAVKAAVKLANSGATKVKTGQACVNAGGRTLMPTKAARRATWPAISAAGSMLSQWAWKPTLSSTNLSKATPVR